MSIASFRQKVATNVTKSSDTDYIESSELREVYNLAADEIVAKGLFFVNTTDDLAAWDDSEADLIGVIDAGIFRFQSGGVPDGINSFPGSGGIWVAMIKVISSADIESLRNALLPEKILIRDGDEYVIRQDILLEKIVILPTDDITISIGSVPFMDDILPDLPLSAGKAEVIVLNLYAQEDKAMYFSGITNPTNIIFYKQ